MIPVKPSLAAVTGRVQKTQNISHWNHETIPAAPANRRKLKNSWRRGSWVGLQTNLLNARPVEKAELRRSPPGTWDVLKYPRLHKWYWGYNYLSIRAGFRNHQQNVGHWYACIFATFFMTKEISNNSHWNYKEENCLLRVFENAFFSTHPRDFFVENPILKKLTQKTANISEKL